MTLSDLIVRYLEQFGVEYVFSVPGGPLGALYDALVRSEKRGGPRAILARHECGAAFMADGYARATGKIGVCCATTGPGATNLITGIAEAHADHIPMLVITAQTVLSTFSLGGFQESSPDVMDIVAMFRHCTRYSTLVSHPELLEQKLAAALITAMQSPKGPAHLSVPVDILRATAPRQVCFPHLHSLSTTASTIDSAAMEKLCRELASVLKAGRRVVLFIGHDCGEARREILLFAEHIRASIITTQRGKSHVNPYHPLYCGVFGFAGHGTAREALSDESVGLILAAGTNLNEWSTAGWDEILLNGKLVHIHTASSFFSRSPMARLHVCGNIRVIFQELISRFADAPSRGHGTTGGSREAPVRLTNERKSIYTPPQIKLRSPNSSQQENTLPERIRPQWLIRKIVECFPLETHFLIDNSNSVPWTIHYFFHPRPENYHLSIGFASMGWAIGASVGMALGLPGTPVVCFTGDGCFLMNGQEITVAVRERLPVTYVVVNDRAYGMIRHGHRLTGSEPVDFSIPPVDFCQMAKAVGADGYTIRCHDDFERLDIQSLHARPGPTILDVHIDPDEPPPLGR